MISSKPADRPVLDHDQVEDVLGNLYVVVGNTHPPNALVSYVKYVPTKRLTLWCRRGVCYDRVVKHYGVKNVVNSTERLQEYVYDPVLGARVPVVRLSRVVRLYYPEVRLAEIVKRPVDRLEEDVVRASEILRSYGVPWSSLGVGGSALPSIHNVGCSDVDMVVYGCRESVEVVESRFEGFSRLGGDVVRRKFVERSRRHGLSVEVLRAIYPPYKDLVIGGRKVNLSFVCRQVQRYGHEVFRVVGIVEAVVDILGGDCRSLFYPSRAEVLGVHSIKVWGARSSRSLNDLRRGLRYVVSYEGIYSYVMYRGGRVRVSGVLEEVLPSGDYVVVVGAYENPGFIYWGPARAS